MVNEQALDQRLTVLEAARPWSPRVVAKIEGHIRSARSSQSILKRRHEVA